MTSEHIPTQWDFTPVLDLLHALSQSRPPDIDSERASTPPSHPSSPCSPSKSPKRHATLGDFHHVFKLLGRPTTNQSSRTQAEAFNEESSASDSETTPPTTPLVFDAEHSDNLVRTKEVKWRDDVLDAANAGYLTHKHSLQGIALDELKSGVSVWKTPEKAHPYNHHRRYWSRRTSTKAFGGVSTFDSETDDIDVDRRFSKGQYGISEKSRKGAVKSVPISMLDSAKSVHPVQANLLGAQFKFLKSPVCVESGTITPMLYLTREEKKARLVRRLVEKFGSNFLQHFDFTRALSQYGGNDADDGIHVFVDSSNIAIGFYDSLKVARGLQIRAVTKRAPLSFHSLAIIMERGRGVAKRVLVGSTDRNGYIPDYMREAVRCGYEVSSLGRVEKFKEDRSTAKKSRGGNGYGTSGMSSGSETPYSNRKKITEQGVDEILHMKMLESIVDAEQPSTIVLASGDAAEAEYSGGFLKNVERALNKGWKVELVAWGHSMSKAYRSRDFLEKWKSQFTIIELDDFTEELLGMYISPVYRSDVRYTGPGEPFDEDLSCGWETF